MGAIFTLEQLYESPEHQEVAKPVVDLLNRPNNPPTPEEAATAFENYFLWMKKGKGAKGVPGECHAKTLVANRLAKEFRGPDGEELWIHLRDLEHFNGPKENMDKFAKFHRAYCDIGDYFEKLAGVFGAIKWDLKGKMDKKWQVPMTFIAVGSKVPKLFGASSPE